MLKMSKFYHSEDPEMVKWVKGMLDDEQSADSEWYERYEADQCYMISSVTEDTKINEDVHHPDDKIGVRTIDIVIYGKSYRYHIDVSYHSDEDMWY